MPPRRLLIFAAAGLLLGAGLWWWLSPTSFVLQVVAASGSEAAVLSRQNTDHRTAFWITMQTTDGPAWVHRVSPDDGDVSAESLTVSADRVTYLMLRERTLVVVGLDRESGEVVWETPLGEAEAHYLTTWLYATAQAVGGVLLVPYVQEEGMLAALELSDGSLRWKQALPETSELPTADGDRLWLQEGSTHALETVDLSDGSRTLRSDAAFNQCLLDGAIYTVQDGALVQVFPADGAAPIPLPVDGARLRACGEHDGAMILTMSVDDLTVLARVEDGAVTKTLALEWPHTGGGPSNRIARFHQDSHALKGEMPRFLPLMFSAMDPDVDALRFVVVDLSDLRIAAEAAPHRDYLFFEQVRAGDTHYFWYHGGLTITVNGSTGKLGGTRRGGRSLDRRSIADGVLWMGGEGSEGWQPPRRPAVVWLDGESLEVLGSAGKTDAFVPADDAITELTGWSLP